MGVEVTIGGAVVFRFGARLKGCIPPDGTFKGIGI